MDAFVNEKKKTKKKQKKNHVIDVKNILKK
jgi:hypothetical protein